MVKMYGGILLCLVSVGSLHCMNGEFKSFLKEDMKDTPVSKALQDFLDKAEKFIGPDTKETPEYQETKRAVEKGMEDFKKSDISQERKDEILRYTTKLYDYDAGDYSHIVGNGKRL